MEPFYPLHVLVCDECFLVQLDQYVTPDDIFSEYAYFSSYSDSWVEHARRYVEHVTARLGLTAASQVMEIASNDGYLLQHFVRGGIPVLGIEPAANVAKVAIDKGIPTTVRFFGVETANAIRAETGAADLLVGNNVLAHVPDINDFVGGLKILLAPAGTITMEFPHLVTLIEGNQFDTIYHEHFSYFSLLTRADDLRRRTACGCTTSRRSRPMAGPSGSTRATAMTPGHRFARDDPGGPRGGVRRPPPRDVPQLRRTGAGDEAQAAGIPDRGQTRRAIGGRIRRAG